MKQDIAPLLLISVSDSRAQARQECEKMPRIFTLACEVMKPFADATIKSDEAYRQMPKRIG